MKKTGRQFEDLIPLLEEHRNFIFLYVRKEALLSSQILRKDT